MERARITRYIRIAVTALSLTACLLLTALWVRSYSYVDILWGSPSEPEFLTIAIHQGTLTITLPLDGFPPLSKLEWEVAHYPIEFYPMPQYWFPSFDRHEKNSEFVLPFWVFGLGFGAIGAAPWIRWSKRFSLRTLLIATALVAVGLGTVIYLAR